MFFNQNGEQMLIRKLEPEDNIKFLALLNKLDAETEFRAYEPGERNINSDEFYEILLEYFSKENNIIFVAIDNDNFIGYIEGMGGAFRRNSHNLHISIGILQDYVGKKIGTELFNAIEEWAVNNKIHRLELNVFDYNERGINLYKKMNYQIEGIKKDSFLVNGNYVNEIMMAKII